MKNRSRTSDTSHLYKYMKIMHNGEHQQEDKSNHKKKSEAKKQCKSAHVDVSKKMKQSGIKSIKKTTTHHEQIFYSPPNNLNKFYYGGTNYYEQIQEPSHVKMMSAKPKSMKDSKNKSHDHKKGKKTKSKIISKKKHSGGEKKEEQIEDYIMVGGDFYRAETHTQRAQYRQYVHQYKIENSVIRNNLQSIRPIKKKIRDKNIYENQNKYQINNIHKNERQEKQEEIGEIGTTKPQSIDMEQFLHNLSVDQKMRILKQLDKQLGTTSTPEFVNSQSSNWYPKSTLNNRNKSNSDDINSHAFSNLRNLQSKKSNNNKQQYQDRVAAKLSSLQNQLITKHNSQMNKIQKMYHNKVISAVEFQSKKSLLENNRKQKIKFIEFTHSIFENIFANNGINFMVNQHSEHETWDQIIRKLDDFHGFASQEVIQESKSDRNQISEVVHDSLCNQTIDNRYGEIQSLNINKNKSPHNQIQFQILQKQEECNQNSEDMLLITPQRNFSLDKNVNKGLCVNLKLQDISEKNQQKKVDIEIPSLAIQPKEDVLTELHSQEQLVSNNKLKIPLLLTKQKMEELENQRKIRVNQRLKTELQRKIAFQMSQFEYQNDHESLHFTTLADINSFIVSLYEFIMRIDLDRVVEKLNLPYGKSVRDKLFILQNFTSQQLDSEQAQYYNVLEEHYFHQFNKHHMPEIKESQMIHNRAIFDAFNYHLNVYRPYFQLEGEVYPWQVSQKGITFYEISEDNVEEVFEKTKIKILEYAATLCGVMLREDQHMLLIKQQNNHAQIMKEKHKEHQLKEEKSYMVEQYTKWDIKLVDEDTQVRMILAEMIIEHEIIQATKQLLPTMRLQTH